MTNQADALDLRTSSTAASIAPFAEPHRWNARVVAQRVATQAHWLPSAAIQQQLAASGVQIRCDRSHYQLRFEITAADLALATRAAMARWVRLCEVYRLPDWPLMSLNVTHVDDQQDHATSGAPDASRPVGPASLTSTSPHPSAQRSAANGGPPSTDDRSDEALLVGGRA